MTDSHAARLAEALEELLPLLNNIEYHDNNAVQVRTAMRKGETALADWRALGGCADGFDLVQFIGEQIEFSERTFGPGTRTSGVIAHIRKELAEIEESPHDLTEWVDVMLLAFDGAWRAGYRPDEIAAALRAKFEKNKRRSWPDWRQNTDGPIEHIPEPSDV